MKRKVFLAISTMCGKAILLTMIAGLIIVVIGYMNKWDTSIAYSNAFFVAGCLLIAAGGLTRMAAGQNWNSFQYLHSDSLRGLSPGERADYIINASSSFNLVILGLLSGALLILIAAILTKIF